MKDLLNAAVERTRASSSRIANVVQHADARLHSPEDAKFVDEYLAAFGARVDSGGVQLPADAGRLRAIAARPDTPRITESELWDEPTTTKLIVDYEGQVKSLALATKIQGVKLLFDGSAVDQPESAHSRLRAMLAIDLGANPS